MNVRYTYICQMILAAISKKGKENNSEGPIYSVISRNPNTNENIV